MIQQTFIYRKIQAIEIVTQTSRGTEQDITDTLSHDVGSSAIFENWKKLLKACEILKRMSVNGH